MRQIRPKIDVTNRATGERLQRVQWSRDCTSITVYTNFGVWKVFTGERARMVNQAFINTMNDIEQRLEREKEHGKEQQHGHEQ